MARRWVHLRHSLVGHRPKRPEFASLGQVDAFGFALHLVIAWIRRTGLYPLAQGRTLVIRELVLGRHLQIVIFVTHRAQQQATFRVTGDNCRAGVTPRRPSPATVQQQTTLQFLGLGGMALVTMLVQ